MNLKTILITLTCVAVVLGLITFYIVFYGGGGTYVVSSALGPDADIFATSTAGASPTASSTASSTLADASSSASSTISSSSTSATIGTAPVTWTQGNETLSITGASIAGTQLTLDVQVVMGSVGECVPLNLRLIADEEGDLSPPITPQFTFPDTGTCNGTPGETYSAQPIVFTLADPGAFPIVLTTGGVANILFEVTQNPDGSLSVQLPPQSD
ncbi:MAG TPA: hypothetical protein VMR99_02895 [Candidatus Paceibacterota bacterium]|nr:hypothetical protein [Candidatus Paceibacterota bacterium]